MSKMFSIMFHPMSSKLEAEILVKSMKNLFSSPVLHRKSTPSISVKNPET